MTATILEPGPLRDMLAFVARRPLLPPRYIALVLDQDPDELAIRLDVAVGLGWLREQPACCGHGSRYAVTAAGRVVLADGM